MNYLYAFSRLHDGSLALTGWASLPDIPSRHEIAATASALVNECGSAPMTSAAIVEHFENDRLIESFTASSFVRRSIKKGV